MLKLLGTMAAIWIAALVAPLQLHAEEASNPNIYIASYIEATYAGKAQVATQLRQLRDAGRNDAGRLRFEVLQRTSPSNQFMILETWKDQPALDKHLASAHRRQFREKIEPFLIAPIDDRLCVPTSVSAIQAVHPSRTTVFLVTHVDVPGVNRDKLMPALQALAEASRRDAGNQLFDVGYQKNRTNHFTVVEGWKDQKSNEAHELAAHTREFRNVLTPLTGAMYDQRWYKPL